MSDTGDYEWIDVGTFGDPDRRIRGRCLHRTRHIVPVYALVTGEHVANLCVLCDEQLEPEWRGHERS
ncbi:hypothetical protein OV450_3406 [Actinobacteria bacterium OV450]|nr:hypothetical protein OV450_3406 [Actinobacteria bacterium OV450]